jgi:hypothetical protein
MCRSEWHSDADWIFTRNWLGAGEGFGMSLMTTFFCLLESR